jgi:glycosyltransferase involved in cell wall biosynthesis
MNSKISLKILSNSGHAPTPDGEIAVNIGVYYDLICPADIAMPHGHYKLTLRGSQALETLRSPSLLFGYGRGVQQRSRISPTFHVTGSGEIAAYLRLDSAPARIRFRPELGNGTLALREARLEKVSKLEWYGRIVITQARDRLSSPAVARQSLGQLAQLYRNHGLTGIAAYIRQANLRTSAALTSGDYRTWVERYDTLDEVQRIQIVDEIKSMARTPRISIILPTYNTPEKYLRECIESVLSQYYGNWELCIADDCSKKQHVKRILKEYAARDSRIKVRFRSKNGHISRASNTALAMATGEWIALLDHDDELRPHALYHVAKAINANTQAKLIYSDEDKLSPDGVRSGPYFKCDWNYELFLSHNLITHLGVYDAKLMREIGGFRSGYDGAQDYDLALRFVARIKHDQIIHIPHVLYHWRQIPGSTAMGSDEKPYAMLAGERALNDHLAETGTNAKAELIGFGFRVRYALPDPQPSVAIIIPTRNGVELLKRCITSIREKTTYVNYKILIVDNGSDDSVAIAYMEGLEKKGIAEIIRDPSEFNYSALNNRAVAAVDSDFVVLMNNDIEVITPGWLEEMIGNAMQPGVGAVGAMLYYPNDTIQHAGVIMGLGGYAAHAHHQFPRGTPGYVGRAALRQSYSAVTAACLAVKREHYLAVGGLDAEAFKVAYNDVDFCLKLKAAGLRNIWTPFAEFYHHESATRGYETTPEKQKRFDGEKANLLAKWSAIIQHDPAYSPNLTTGRADFSLAFPPRRHLDRH